MGNFNWLQFSDLHLSAADFDSQFARSELIESLAKLRASGELSCDYVFITGDIAHKGNYEDSKEFIGKLLDALGMSNMPNRVFWTVGNHDISREDRNSRLRRSVIGDIRSKTDSPYEFEEAMKDAETRRMLTEVGMADYVKWHETLLKRPLTNDEVSAAHVSYALPDLNLVVLNTCLTSCDDNDEGQLYIKESGLYGAFEGLDHSKPTFVMGHHGHEFLAPESKTALAHLFDSSGVDLYLCGHSRALGYDVFGEASRYIHQLASGGLDVGGKFSFLYGEYNDTARSVLIKPYSFSRESRSWAHDSNLHRMLDGVRPLYLTSRSLDQRVHSLDSVQKANATWTNAFRPIDRILTVNRVLESYSTYVQTPYVPRIIDSIVRKFIGLPLICQYLSAIYKQMTPLAYQNLCFQDPFFGINNLLDYTDNRRSG